MSWSKLENSLNTNSRYTQLREKLIIWVVVLLYACVFSGCETASTPTQVAWSKQIIPRRFWHGDCILNGPYISGEFAIVAGDLIGLHRGKAVALDITTGKERWRVDIENYPKSKIIGTGSRVFLHTGKVLYAISVNNGEIIWHKEYDPLRTRGDLALIGDRLIVAGEGPYIAALDIENGNTIWQTKLEYWIDSAPFIDGTDIWTIDRHGFYYKISSKNGEIVEKRRFVQKLENYPVFSNGFWLLSETNKDSKLGHYQLSKYDAYSGKKVWSIESNFYLGPAKIHKTLLSIPSKNGIELRDISTGEVKKEITLKPNPVGRYLVTIYNDALYTYGNLEDIYAFDLSSGKLLWKVDSDEVSDPVVPSGNIIFHTDRSCFLFAIHAK